MFDIHQPVYDETGDWEGKIDDYCNGLMQQFAESAEGSAAAEHHGPLRWAHSFLDYGFRYCGSAPPEMTRRDVEEILFELFPQKVSTEPEAASEIIGELRAFWEFLRRQYDLANATDILECLGEGAEQLLARELADSDNFGMAKSFAMMGKEAGFDMTTQEGWDQFMHAYNASIAASPGLPAPGQIPNSRNSLSKRPKRNLPTNPISADRRKAREKLLRKKLSRSKRNR